MLVRVTQRPAVLLTKNEVQQLGFVEVDTLPNQVLTELLITDGVLIKGIGNAVGAHRRAEISLGLQLSEDVCGEELFDFSVAGHWLQNSCLGLRYQSCFDRHTKRKFFKYLF